MKFQNSKDQNQTDLIFQELMGKPNLPQDLFPPIGGDSSQLHYKFDENPPLSLSILLGFQHFLLMISGSITIPFVICPALCMTLDDPHRGYIISALIFVAGTSTLLQTTFGTRLPMITGDCFTYIIPTLAILSLPQWKCPEGFSEKNPYKSGNQTLEESTEMWQVRMREIQGSVIIAGLFECLLGLSGAVGKILKFISPLTYGPAMAVVGLSLFKTAAHHASSNWAISFATIASILIFSFLLKSVKFPIPSILSGNVGRREESENKYPLFEIFSILLSVILIWTLCAILTAFDLIGKGSPGRTDSNFAVSEAPWFRMPFPFQFGWPTFTLGASIGMFSSAISSIMEGLGNYYATAKVSGASRPPKHAVNRGVFFKGIGTICAGVFGTGNGTTTHSEHTGTMSLTKVASRRVFQCAGIIMILISMFGKIGAFFISIPDPIVGGLFFIIFASIASVGLGCLQAVDMTSSRNQFIVGFSVFSGLSLSEWMGENPNAIQLGEDNLNQIVYILLRTGMFVSGFIGFILDNLIKGTPEERGTIILAEEVQFDTESDNDELTGLLSGSQRNKDYDLPFGMKIIRRSSILKYFPISPTYN